MATDARISVGLPAHPKTKKLIKRHGQEAAWNLVCLFLWVASNRPDGCLSGMSEEDIEMAADWRGADGDFVKALQDVRFLDSVDGDYMLHDWSEHNPWAAGSNARSAKARWNAAKRHHGIAEADRLVPEYAAIRTANSNATSNAHSNAGSTDAAQDEQTQCNAPSPSPSPSPSPLPFTKEEVLSLSPSSVPTFGPVDDFDPIDDGLVEQPALTPTDYGRICMAIKRLGVPDTSPGNPEFRTLVEAGSDEQEWISAATDAVSKGKASFKYVVAIVANARKRAAGLSIQIHRGAMPSKSQALLDRNLAVAGEWASEMGEIHATV